MKRPHFCGISIFLHFLSFGGLFDLYFFPGIPERVKSAVFSILPDPGCPRGPMVGPHTDCVVSWDTVGGIQALGGPQGPLQTGFGVAQDGPVGVLAVLQGKFGWERVKILQVVRIALFYHDTTVGRG